MSKNPKLVFDVPQNRIQEVAQLDVYNTSQYLIITTSNDVLVVSVGPDVVKRMYKAAFPVHAFGLPMAATWIPSLAVPSLAVPSPTASSPFADAPNPGGVPTSSGGPPTPMAGVPVIASQKGLLLYINPSAPHRAGVLDGFRGRSVVGVGQVGGRLIVLEQAGVLHFFDVCADPMFGYKLANGQRLVLHMRGWTASQPFTRLRCIAHWVLLLTSLDCLLLVDAAALHKRWKLGAQTALLPVHVLNTSGVCDTCAAAHILYAPTTAQTILAAELSLDSTGQPALLALLTTDRSLVVLLNPARNKFRTRPETVSGRTPNRLPDLPTRWTRTEHLPDSLAKCPQAFTLLPPCGLCVQRTDRQLLHFPDLASLGMAHSTLPPTAACDLLERPTHAIRKTKVNILGQDGTFTTYTTTN
ncbi:hypothetical protein GNI_107280 [Gregarina niphandrodes]|uniref:Uncharacterized protein n=1 Tax=Gregarina niphandrodes TaxID=110365 RepID=A0A023B3U3_GRENI|nr:hypothetical protein GNI_107280 [Gregarina niphandrodes]EZG55918.1 hypothetical protein GNI_107280 [Gregarina niphandrodes]|eukprot:XP_011131411.1 hypothetical protein GNI_107280 [Gregarina niphandrodes]